ncbi:putative metalloreductase Fre8 [Aspergillus undulatus]|uniref:putative metalloreductase Fre8 n=1 Tax=Aspergillus undulatus TaxID=1810928 RepID=UPI003CCD619E
MSLAWPWHFVSVSDAEKQHRRELLTLRGYYAQLSILFAIVLYRFFIAFFSSNQQQRKLAVRSRQKSWLDAPLFNGWFETRRQYLACLIWLTGLLSLSIWDTGDDYLHLTKALGHVGLSQVPLQVAISPAFYVTSTPRASSLFSVLTTIPQPELTAYHRLFARVVISPLLVGHAILYSLFFLQSSHPEFSSLFAKRILDLDVQLGISAVAAAIAILVFARPKGTAGGMWKGSVQDRRRAFYAVHLLLVGVLCLAAYFHVAQARAFVLQSLVAFVVNLGCCYATAK